MKRNNFKFIFGFALLAVMASCSEDDDATKERIVKSVVTADMTTFNVTEGDVATVTLTIDKPLNVRSDFKLELVGGTGSFRDYAVDGDETVLDDGYGIIGHKVTFPAYASTSTFDITPLLDYFPEGAETLIFRLYPMANSTALVNANSETITLNVANGTLNEVQMELNWAGTTNSFGNIVDMEYVGDDGVSHSFADFDFDLIVLGPANIFTGATGAQPEFAKIASTRPDGFYDVVIDLWDTTGAATPAKKINFKPMLTISKPGVWVEVMDLSGIWSSDDLGSGSGPAADIWAGYVQKAGTTFTLFDTLDVQLQTGRTAPKKLPDRKSVV